MKVYFHMSVHWLHWKVKGNQVTTARIILLFVDRWYLRAITCAPWMYDSGSPFKYLVYIVIYHDIFENFWNSCIISYGLYPAYYYTLPGFTWDAMLKHTRINFELFIEHSHGSIHWICYTWQSESMFKQVCAGTYSCTIHRNCQYTYVL